MRQWEDIGVRLRLYHVLRFSNLICYFNETKYKYKRCMSVVDACPTVCKPLWCRQTLSCTINCKHFVVCLAF
jgi:hypothetical protein